MGAASRILRTAPQSGPRREDWAQQAVPLRKWQEVQILPRQGRREAVLRTLRGIRFRGLEVGYDAERMVAEQWRRQALEAQERALAVLPEDVEVEAGVVAGRDWEGAHAGLLAAGGRRGAHDGTSRLGPPVARVFLARTPPTKIVRSSRPRSSSLPAAPTSTSTTSSPPERTPSTRARTEGGAGISRPLC